MMPQDPQMQPQEPSAQKEPMADQGMEVEQFEATPEQQAQYEAVVNEALNVISDTPDKFEAFMQAIEAGGDRVMQSVGLIVVTMIDAAEKKIGPVEDGDVIEAAAEALITEVYGMALEEGIVPQEVMSEDVMTATYLEFATAWAQAHPERLDEEDQMALQEMMAERKAAMGGPPGEKSAMAKGVAEGSRPQRQGLLVGGMA